MTIPDIYGRWPINHIRRWLSHRQTTKEYNILCKYFPPKEVARMMINHSYGVTPIQMVEPVETVTPQAIIINEGTILELSKEGLTHENVKRELHKRLGIIPEEEE